MSFDEAVKYINKEIPEKDIKKLSTKALNNVIQNVQKAILNVRPKVEA